MQSGPTVKAFEPVDLRANGMTAMTGAVKLLAEALSDENREKRKWYAPVCILISDGFATDDPSPVDASPTPMDQALAELERSKAGRKAFRFAIGIGSDFDEDTLRRFVSGKYREDPGVLRATDAVLLRNFLEVGVLSSVQASSRNASAVDSTDDVREAFRRTKQAARPQYSDQDQANVIF
jgi:uncharacterized protein YegL